LRVGNATKEVPKPEWQERDVVSEYSFAAVGPEHAPHEMRQVVSVDGRKIQESKKAQDELAKLVVATDDQRKLDALRKFESLGLRGGATDLGQLLLLFDRGQQERYEFLPQGIRSKDGVDAAVIGYRQLDGPEAVTIYRGKSPAGQKMRMEGEIWARSTDGMPLRITMTVSGMDDDSFFRQEILVDYQMSEFGMLLPATIQHKEWRGADMVAENRFTYANFRKFAASTEIRFDVK
jgi:hypothetical protein